MLAFGVLEIERTQTDFLMSTEKLSHYPVFPLVSKAIRLVLR
jgi:hypothetical protein